MKLVPVLFPCHNGLASFWVSAEGFCFQAQPPCVGRGLARRRERGWLVGLALAELALTIDKDVSGRLGLDVVLYALGPTSQSTRGTVALKEGAETSAGTDCNKRENDVGQIKFATGSRMANSSAVCQIQGYRPLSILCRREGLLVVTSAGGCGHAYSSNVPLVVV